jgi:diguanylate cyclase (GGDEF)-like protein
LEVDDLSGAVQMNLAAALIYWVIIGLWIAVLATVGAAFVRNSRMFGRTRLLLSVILVDTARNIVENLYFGLYFGGQYGLLPPSFGQVLGSPTYLILPKVMNVVAASAVLGLLILRWLPFALKERADADAHMKQKDDALKQESAERQRLVLFDPLTGLPNRMSLQMDIERLLGPKGRAGSAGLTLAVVDLDRFNDVNDTLGHAVGDKVLWEVARRLTAAISKSPVYRLSEDEFVVLLKDCGDPLVAAAQIERALDSLTELLDLDGEHLFITASAGLAVAPAHGSTFEELLSNAELALYDAKGAGGRIQRLFFPALRAKAQHRRELDNELRRAWVNREFVLYFQPQLRSVDGAVIGAEALIRWNHPDRGILDPVAFIDALAESPLAMEVGLWILETACTTASYWRAKGLHPVRISVNLFPTQFRSESLQQDVENALFKSALPAEALELEITENIALASDEATLSQLRRLRASGVGIVFDDFGTGYASLSYLTRYPLTQIKIDRGFIEKLGTPASEKDEAIVRSIIAMARNLQLDIVAEGVENTLQADLLRAEGCHTLQGYLFSKPVSADAFERYLRSSCCDWWEFTPRRLAG